MMGRSWIREQGMQDALLCASLRERDMTEVPLWQREFPARDAMMAHWDSLTPNRDGPVTPNRSHITDPQELSDLIKKKASDLGASDTGMTILKPEFIELGIELPHKNVIAVIVYEDYAKALEGPDEVDLEAMTAYAKCADISTDLAKYIREELGYTALAHHNGSFQIQAIPVFQEVGFGELGRNGSLIHPEFGSNFRPGFITTDLPVAYDTPRSFGIQDYCSSCNLCRNNCPGDAIPDEHIVTDGVKRWLTNIERCYPISRFRESYCHICIDVCPYIWKENGDTEKRSMFRDYMKIRKEEGYKTPKGPDTQPSTEVTNKHAHRSIDENIHPTEIPADLKILSEAALTMLARHGAKADHIGGTSSRYCYTKTREGVPFNITLTGPDLPLSVPSEMILPSDIPKDPHWRETYHLSVAPPNIALELTWGPDDPLRILNFSRGDWETQLLKMAG
jgi:formate hydrogenlyase subunit 6/NADH:ubiquinone oxidoreductase subunit I